MNFYTGVFVLAVVACIGYSVFYPLIFMARHDYTGRWHVFAWKAAKLAVVFAAVVLLIQWYADHAPAYFWWMLLAGGILLSISRGSRSAR